MTLFKQFRKDLKLELSSIDDNDLFGSAPFSYNKWLEEINWVLRVYNLTKYTTNAAVPKDMSDLRRVQAAADEITEKVVSAAPYEFKAQHKQQHVNPLYALFTELQARFGESRADHLSTMHCMTPIDKYLGSSYQIDIDEVCERAAILMDAGFNAFGTINVILYTVKDAWPQYYESLLQNTILDRKFDAKKLTSIKDVKKVLLNAKPEPTTPVKNKLADVVDMRAQQFHSVVTPRGTPRISSTPSFLELSFDSDSSDEDFILTEQVIVDEMDTSYDEADSPEYFSD